MPNLFVPSSTYSQQVFHRWPLWLVPTTSAISEMTYTVSSGMLNSSIPYQQLPLSYFTQSASSSCSEWGRIMLVVHVSRHVIHWRTSVTQINHVSVANCTSVTIPYSKLTDRCEAAMLTPATDPQTVRTSTHSEVPSLSCKNTNLNYSSFYGYNDCIRHRTYFTMSDKVNSLWFVS